MAARSKIALVAALLALAPSARAEPPGETWSRADGPSAGPSAAIGSPAAGCLAGAAALPVEGEGYQVLRRARGRFWGHPRTVALVQALGAEAGRLGLGTLLVGDLSQPRGGPMRSGHGSHQNGLDADIWFLLPEAPLAAKAREAPEPVAMVKKGRLDARHWGERQALLLELAASAPGVDRIFVNPAIKAEMCRRRPGAAWLSRLRPWWGHDSHFHIRLSCPEGDPACQGQKPVPPGDGCGAELASWFKEAAVILPDDKPNLRNPRLPAACGAVLEEGARTVPAAAR